jgi:hypothetical protein
MGFGTQAGNSRSFHVRIDELVLHGFARADRHRIAQALELELARLIRERPLQGFGKRASVFERVDGGAFRVNPGSNAQTAGTQIAQAVYRSLRQQTRASAGSRGVRPAAGGLLP